MQSTCSAIHKTYHYRGNRPIDCIENITSINLYHYTGLVSTMVLIKVLTVVVFYCFFLGGLLTATVNHCFFRWFNNHDWV